MTIIYNRFQYLWVTIITIINLDLSLYKLDNFQNQRQLIFDSYKKS